MLPELVPFPDRQAAPHAGRLARVERELETAGIAPTRENGMHALRHHYASVMLAGGASIRALADYLGHADPGFTLRVYAHLMPDDEDRARSVMDAALGPRADSLRTGEVSP